MRPFRSNQKRNRNKGSQDRSFKRINGVSMPNSDFGNRENGFRRKQNRNNGNVEKLIINPDLTLDKVLLLQEQTKDCILNIYTNCEKYFIFHFRYSYL